ncbi:hypothetical protein, partial [Terribacillus sp. AE2B 122]
WEGWVCSASFPLQGTSSGKTTKNSSRRLSKALRLILSLRN